MLVIIKHPRLAISFIIVSMTWLSRFFRFHRPMNRSILCKLSMIEHESFGLILFLFNRKFSRVQYFIFKATSIDSDQYLSNSNTQVWALMSKCDNGKQHKIRTAVVINEQNIQQKKNWETVIIVRVWQINTIRWMIYENNAFLCRYVITVRPKMLFQFDFILTPAPLLDSSVH